MMKQAILISFLFIEVVTTFGQERYYFDIPTRARARYEIDVNNSKENFADGVKFIIESLTLLKPKKSWRNDDLRFISVFDSTIYATDYKRTNLFLFDMDGNAILKVDLSKFDEKFKITDSEFYNDTLYLVDNESLFLLRFTSKGNFVSKSALSFNFRDFHINRKGIYFISKHLDGKRVKKIRISLFDLSLNLLKQCFITDKLHKTELCPKFVLGGEDQVLFLMTACNQVYNLEKDGLSLYLQAAGGYGILDYVNASGFHKIKEMYLVQGQSFKDVITYYFPNGKLKSGISFSTSSMFWSGKHAIHKGNRVGFINMKEDSISNLLKMDCIINHKIILDLIEKVGDNNKFVVVSFKEFDSVKVEKGVHQ